MNHCSQPIPRRGIMRVQIPPHRGNLATPPFVRMHWDTGLSGIPGIYAARDKRPAAISRYPLTGSARDFRSMLSGSTSSGIWWSTFYRLNVRTFISVIKSRTTFNSSHNLWKKMISFESQFRKEKYFREKQSSIKSLLICTTRDDIQLRKAPIRNGSALSPDLFFLDRFWWFDRIRNISRYFNKSECKARKRPRIWRFDSDRPSFIPRWIFRFIPDEFLSLGEN